MASIKKPPVYRVTIIQAGVLIPLSVLLFLVDTTVAYSSLLGGMLCLVPNTYFAHYAFRYSGAQVTRQIARAFYWGETGKFLLTMVGFALVFVLIKPLNLVALFIVYAVMLALQWLASARIICP